VVGEAVADGKNTIRLIAEALRNRAIQTSRTEAAIEHEMLAAEIEALGARQR
jgi:hypothetical protein